MLSGQEMVSDGESLFIKAPATNQQTVLTGFLMTTTDCSVIQHSTGLEILEVALILG